MSALDIRILSRAERERLAYQQREAERRVGQRKMRRAVALERHARLVYDHDRDFAGEFSSE